MFEMHPTSLDSEPVTLSRMDGGGAFAVWDPSVWDERRIEYPNSAASIDTRPAGAIEFTPDGSFIKAKRTGQFMVRSSMPAQLSSRGAVTGFSRKSRNRLLQKLAMLKRSELPLFVTLTYPGTFPVDPKDWKRHIDTFSKRFCRRFPNAGFIWKLEPQKRGAPHFHLLAWDSSLTPVEFYAYLKNWIKTAWYEVVGSGDERHLRAGTGVEIVRSFQGVMYYASKYMSKAVDGEVWGHPGRWWGVVGRTNIPYAEKLVAWLCSGDVNALIRWIQDFRNLERRPCNSRWAVVEAPGKWFENVGRFQEMRHTEDRGRGLTDPSRLPG